MNEKLSASVLCLILVLVVKAEEFTDDQRNGHILSQGKIDRLGNQCFLLLLLGMTFKGSLMENTLLL